MPPTRAGSTRAALQERSLLKSVGLAGAMTDALIGRGIPDSTARLAAEMGLLAFSRGFAEWSTSDEDSGDALARRTLVALDELRVAAAALG